MSARPMPHDEAWEALSSAALGSLDSAEAAALQGHLSECPACRNELHAMQEAASTLMLAAAPTSRPSAAQAAVRDRLLVRVRADKERPLAPTQPQRQESLKRLEWLGIAASLLLVASTAGLAVLMHERAALRSALEAADHRIVAQELAMDSLHAAVESRDATLESLTGKDMAMVRLSSNVQHEAWAVMFWNRQTNAWTFMAHDLPAPRPGRTYQLWLVTAKAKISAGTFMPQANGDATLHATYALPHDALMAVAVTDEPSGGMPQPTGPFVVIGAESPAGR